MQELIPANDLRRIILHGQIARRLVSPIGPIVIKTEWMRDLARQSRDYPTPEIADPM
jgi:hypothetical protein